METLKCLRCNHEWYPRSPKKPKQCPACNTKYWDRPRREKKDADTSKGPRAV